MKWTKKSVAAVAGTAMALAAAGAAFAFIFGGQGHGSGSVQTSGNVEDVIYTAVIPEFDIYTQDSVEVSLQASNPNKVAIRTGAMTMPTLKVEGAACPAGSFELDPSFVPPAESTIPASANEYELAKIALTYKVLEGEDQTGCTGVRLTVDFDVAGGTSVVNPEPTAEPTAEPTVEPSAEPTAAPSAEPTTTEPVADPTDAPGEPGTPTASIVTEPSN